MGSYAAAAEEQVTTILDLKPTTRNNFKFKQ